MSLIACPSCGAEMSLDVALTHEELRSAVHDVLSISLPLGALVMRYIALFKPAKNRLSPTRMARLVTELLPGLQTARLHHKGRDWHMPVESWKAGLEAMLHKAQAGKVDLPLDNHHYLYAILVGLADRAEAQQEQASTAAARTRPAASGAAQSLADMAGQMRAMANEMNGVAGHKPPPGTSPAVRQMKADIAATRALRQGGHNPTEGENP